MTSRMIWVLCASGLVACQDRGNTPEVRPVMLFTAGHSTVAQLRLGLTESPSAMALMTDGPDARLDECTEWLEEVVTDDPGTGVYEVFYTCPSGGNLASIRSVQTQDPETGNHEVTETYTHRDGSVEVWTYTYLPDGSGYGSSLAGDHMEQTQTLLEDGSVQIHQLWTFADGAVMVVDYTIYEGYTTVEWTYDDPATVRNPDEIHSYSETGDGSVWEANWEEDGWVWDVTLTSNADGAWASEFRGEQMSTAVSPDLEGYYAYDESGAGSGQYAQLFDDGGKLEVQDVIDPSGSYVETWTYVDADPTVTLDQEGSISYAVDGSGSGTVTDHFADGTSQTCAITVAADGTHTIGACS